MRSLLFERNTFHYIYTEREGEGEREKERERRRRMCFLLYRAELLDKASNEEP